MCVCVCVCVYANIPSGTTLGEDSNMKDLDIVVSEI